MDKKRVGSVGMKPQKQNEASRLSKHPHRLKIGQCATNLLEVGNGITTCDPVLQRTMLYQPSYPGRLTFTRLPLHSAAHSRRWPTCFCSESARYRIKPTAMLTTAPIINPHRPITPAKTKVPSASTMTNAESHMPSSRRVHRRPAK
jgi:hypothetical protein